MMYCTPSFSHNWKMGDVIYSLPAVRQLGGGRYYYRNRSFMDFLLKQWYVFSCDFFSGQKINYAFGNHGIAEDLIATHFRECNLNPPKIISPWLVGDKSDKEYSIVANVTNRWRIPGINFSFLNDFDEVYFVGFKEEFNQIDFKAKYINSSNFNDFAKVINSCKVFVGTPSVAAALAIGFGKNALVDEGIWTSLKFKFKNKFELTKNKIKNAKILEYILKNQLNYYL